MENIASKKLIAVVVTELCLTALALFAGLDGKDAALAIGGVAAGYLGVQYALDRNGKSDMKEP